MKKILIVRAALMAGTAALAQTTPAPPAPGRAAADVRHPMSDKEMTRDEVVAMVREHFGRLDANKDGAITTEEVTESAGNAGAKDMRFPTRRRLSRHDDGRPDGAIPRRHSTGSTPTRTARSAARSSPRAMSERIERA